MEEEFLFTCKECGAHDLVVVREYCVIDRFEDVVPCTCGSEMDGVAAVIKSYVKLEYCERGLLDDGHRVSYGDPELIEEVEREELDRQIGCWKCFESAEEDTWETHDEDSEFDEESSETYVRCRGCDREIEFGYSHPEGGRIWPADCADFNPWKCFPEARYLEGWRKKGWLRPRKQQRIGRRFPRKE
jgi:hypothetical protein